ncbi:plasmid stabilization protein ParE [Lysobacteraceae bacterium NML95-0200]|nr:plasmid stabilization protein ParE [Xanthomonadaceae bacterium NML95-0200]
MLPITWSQGAERDLLEILSYIADENPLAAEHLRQRLEASVLPLAEHPYMYRSSDRIPGLRELLAHPNYLILYRVGSSHVEITAVVHARRQYP